MKKQLLALTILTLGFQGTNLYAQDFADGAGNGGDICENRIKTIRNDIESWILKGGSNSLKLPQDVTLQDYKSSMLRELKANYPINCTEKKLYLGAVEKTCKNYLDRNGTKRVTCNLNRFQGLSEEDQYRLIHHEYAGLAKLEESTGEESHYPLSNQVSAYLENQIVKRLAIKNVEDLGIELVRISGGTFEMGSPKREDGRYDNEVLRTVIINYDFEMMVTEVTQELYMKVTGLNPSVFKNKENCPDTYKVIETEVGGVDSLCPNHPVENVSFEQVIEFISLLKVKTGKNYRLPTEAEWELAARAGRHTAYSFGNNPEFLNGYAIFKDNSKQQTQAVGPHRKYANKPNKNGLYDMHGNVLEWTQDWYAKLPSGGVNPTGPTTGSHHVFRGGSWYHKARDLRSAYRSGNVLSSGYDDLGFRLVRTIEK